jgi:exonuclease III
LYLYGYKSIIDGTDYDRWDDVQRAQQIKIFCKKSATHQELKRMRTSACFENRFPILNAKDNDRLQIQSIWIMYHNVAGLTCHFDQIKKDFAYKCADIILLGECHTNPANINQYKLNGFKLIHLSGSDKQNASNGLACYIRNELVNKTELVHDNSNNGIYNSTSILEISCIRIKIKDKYHYIVYLYNHPNRPFKDFYSEFKAFLIQYIPNIGKIDAPPVYIFGDVNKDIDKKKDKLAEFQNDLGLMPNVPKIPTTDHATKIDWFLSNNTNLSTMVSSVYESYFSDHKPLTLELFY